MNLQMLTAIFGAITFSLVESRCFPFHPLTKDFEPLCKQWWKKTFDVTDTNSKRKSCITLISKKCPDMLTFQTTITKDYDENRPNHETWTEKVTAIDKYKQKSRTYYLFKKHPLCDEGQAPDCAYWWKVARENKVEDKDKDICVERILKHCDNMIFEVKKEKTGVVKRWLKSFDTISLTFEDKEKNHVSFNRYVLLEKS